MPSASASSWLTVEANNGFQMYLSINKISAPPIQIINRSISFTAKMSPNNSPIISNRIVVRKPITTKPTARDECANKPNNASPGSFVVFWSFKSISAIADEIKKTENAIFNSKKKAIVTPRSAEWDNVSPKKDNLLQIIKHPRGPVTNAIPIPAIKALIKKSSNIYCFLFIVPSGEWVWSCLCSYTDKIVEARSPNSSWYLLLLATDWGVPEQQTCPLRQTT